MLDFKLELCHLLCFKDTLQVLDVNVLLVWYYRALGDFHWSYSHKNASVHP